MPLQGLYQINKITLTHVKTVQKTLFRTTVIGVKTTITRERWNSTPNTWARFCGGHDKSLPGLSVPHFSISHITWSSCFSTHESAMTLRSVGIPGLPHPLCSSTRTHLNTPCTFLPPHHSSIHSPTRMCSSP